MGSSLAPRTPPDPADDPCLSSPRGFALSDAAESILALSDAVKMPSNKVSPGAGGHFPCRPKLALALAVVFVLVGAVAGASYKASYGQDYDYGHDEPDYGYEAHRPAEYRHRYPKATYADSYKVKDYSRGSSYGQGYSKTSYKHEPRGYGYDDHRPTDYKDGDYSYGSQYGDQGYGHSGYEHETYDSYEAPSYRNKRSVDYSRGSSYGRGYSKSYKHEPSYGHEYSRESYKHEPTGYGYDDHKQSYGSRYGDQGYGHSGYEHETYDSYEEPSYRNKRSVDYSRGSSYGRGYSTKSYR